MIVAAAALAPNLRASGMRSFFFPGARHRARAGARSASTSSAKCTVICSYFV